MLYRNFTAIEKGTIVTSPAVLGTQKPGERNIAGRMTVLKSVRRSCADIRNGDYVETTAEIVCAIRCPSCRSFGLYSSIRLNEGAKIRQTIVTGREFRPASGANTREILPELSFGEDSMALV